MNTKTVKISTLLLATALLASCAHSDLKAPCPDNLSFAGSASIDCNKREPINTQSTSFGLLSNGG